MNRTSRLSARRGPVAMLGALLLVASAAPTALATGVSLTASCTVHDEIRADVTGNLGEGFDGSFIVIITDSTNGGLQVAEGAFTGNSFELLSDPLMVVPPYSRLLIVVADAVTMGVMALDVIECTDATPPTITSTCTVLGDGHARVAGTVEGLFPVPGNIGVFDFSLSPGDPQVGFLYPVDNGDFSLTTFDGYTATAGTTLNIGLARGADFHGVATTTTTCTGATYSFGGFLQPVDARPMLNSLKAGAAVPVKFSLGGDRGLDIFAGGYPKSQVMACDSTASVDGIETTVTAGGSGLTYNPATGLYTYVWKSDKAWKGTCRQLVLGLSDGSVQRANFLFN